MQQNNSTDKTASAHKTDEIMVYEHPFFWQNSCVCSIW